MAMARRGCSTFHAPSGLSAFDAILDLSRPIGAGELRLPALLFEVGSTIGVETVAKRIDMAGKRFGRLTAEHPNGSQRGTLMWLCTCDCGNTAIILGTSLRAGLTKSCGCLHVESSRRNGRARRVHGHRAGDSSTREYNSYRSMRERCENPNHDAFSRYGGRGIVVCDRWRNGDGTLSGFECFLKDMGERPMGMSLERIDVDGSYEATNCVWANDAAQMQNTRVNVFTPEQVADIRAVAANENMRPAEIARACGFDAKNVARILTGARWKEARYVDRAA